MPSVSNFKEILLNAIQNNAQNNGAKVSSPERAINQFSFELPRLCIENKIRVVAWQSQKGWVHQQTNENVLSQCNRDQHIEWELIEAPYASRYLHKFLYAPMIFAPVFFSLRHTGSLSDISLLHWLLSLWHSVFFCYFVTTLHRMASPHRDEKWICLFEHWLTECEADD